MSVPAATSTPQRRHPNGPHHNAASSRPRPPSRSSRRITSGNTAPVELGGGVGALGSVMSDQQQALAIQAAFHNTQGQQQQPSRSAPYWDTTRTSAGPSHAGVGSKSQTVPSHDKMPPRPPLPTAGRQPQLRTQGKASSQPGGSAHPPMPPLDTTWGSPTVGSGSSNSMASGTSGCSNSPAHVRNVYSASGTQRVSSQSSIESKSSEGGSRSHKSESQPSVTTRRSSDRLRGDPPPPLPAMAQGPLPDTPQVSSPSSTTSLSPSSSSYGFQSSSTKVKPRKRVPEPITIGPSAVKQDWSRKPDVPNAPPALRNAATSGTTGPRKPMAVMVPVDRGRSVTDPIPDQNYKGSLRGRRSADILRATTPTTDTQNGRKTPTGLEPTSRSRTPSGLDSPDTPTRKSTEQTWPTLRLRKSADLLRRPSAELLGLGAKEKEKSEHQRALGVGQPGTGPTDSRKTPGLSLKKSANNLRNLFGKKKQDVANAPELPRVSVSDIVRPSPPVASMSRNTATPSPGVPMKRIPSSPGRTESPATNTLYTSTRMQRASSDTRSDSPPVSRLSPTKAATVGYNTSTRDPPPLPPTFLSPSDTVPSYGYSSNSVTPTGSRTPTIERALPIQPGFTATSPVGSDGGRSTGSQTTVRQGEDFSSVVLPPSELSPGQPSPQLWGQVSTPTNWSPIKPSGSLHLLQLPELDLGFDVAFDHIGKGGHSGSPTTPRKRSPPASHSRHASLDTTTPPTTTATASPSRSRTISGTSDLRTGLRNAINLSPAEQAARSERRRSKSFDGPGSGQEDPWRAHAKDENWIQPQMAMLFSPSSSSAPLLSPPVENPSSVLQPRPSGDSKPLSLPALATLHSDSARTLPADAYSSIHARTSSGSSSTNETGSSSPPCTPEDTHDGFHAVPKPSPDTKTPVLPKPSGLDAPIELGETSGDALSGVSSVAPSAPRQPNANPSGSTDPVTSVPTVPVPPPKSTARAIAPAKSSAQPSLPTAPLPSVAAPPARKITIPNHDNPAKPPRELEEPREPDQLPPSKAPFKARPCYRVLLSPAVVVAPDSRPTTHGLARELEGALDHFRYLINTNSAVRSLIIRTDLLALMVKVDQSSYDRLPMRDDPATHELRAVLFEWADAILCELRLDQPANERGACLEGLAVILESAVMSVGALEGDRSHCDLFQSLMMRVMTFVMDKLGAKGVFHNTLLFSGRFLAFAFFRVPHVGSQLVGVLHPPRGALMRFTRPVLTGNQIPSEAQPLYPEHLQSLCFDNSQAYTRRLFAQEPTFATQAEREAYHFQPGNWLRRWQSDDSELFPAFYRCYHRQLANYLSPAVEYYQMRNQPVPAHVLLRAPGYAHLATIFAKKLNSYILGSVNAVTTSSSNQHFDATESAGFRGSTKPAVLETANRRLVETMWNFASSLNYIPAAGGRVLECEGAQLWGEVIDVWTKGLIQKTSLFAPKGVFCLYDLLDGIVDPVIVGSDHSPLDVPYLIALTRTILNEGDHALTLVKVIAFVFTHWEILTARPEDRRELCIDILLDRKLFERLLLFWSQSVRSYVLRLVVFRLGHIHTTKADGDSYDVELESVQLLQTRLNRIKKRHDELEPGSPSTPLEGPGTSDPSGEPRTPRSSMPRSRSTITMITDSPQLPSSRAEKLVGLGLGEDDKEAPAPASKSWWKRLGGSKPPKESKERPGKSKGRHKKGKDNKSNDLLKAGDSLSPAMADSSPIIPSPLMATSGLPSNSSGSLASDGNGNSPRPGKENKGLLAPSLMPAGDVSPALSSSSGHSSKESSTAGGNSTPSPPHIRKAPPPNILTGPSPVASPSGTSSKAQFQFEFELPTASPLSDTFDHSANPTSPRRKSQRNSGPPAAGSAPTSPHMSHVFSKRSSLLPPAAQNALDSMGADTLAKLTGRYRAVPEPGYPKHLHAYAIRMLAELEDAQKEYDEWWSEGGIGKVDGAPPRLQVAWPFHEGDD